MPSHVADLLPINPINCKMFLQLFLFSTTFFSILLLPSPNFFDVVALKLKMGNISI